MLIGILFAFAVTSAGVGVLSGLGTATGLTRLGLAPAAGLAFIAVLTSWSVLFGLPPGVSSLLFLGATLVGLVAIVRQSNTIRDALVNTMGGDRLALAVLATAVAVPAVVLSIAFGSVRFPIGGHDGAFHLELVEMLLQGGRWFAAYPPGFHATAAAFIQLLPSTDLPQMLFNTSMGLGILAPLASFGLGYSIWRRALPAACGALLVSLTFEYPYQLFLWSGWPLSEGIMLGVGLWTVGFEYIRQPSWRWTVPAALLAAGVLLVHGTEVYTALIGLILVLLTAPRRAPWRRLPWDAGLSLSLALLLIGPYLPLLLGWASAGGAVQVGYESLQHPTMTLARIDASGELELWLDALGGLVLDAPLRIALLIGGIIWSFQQRQGRVLVALGLVFAAIALIFTYLDNPTIQRIFALTFPWGLRYRLVMPLAIAASLLGGAALASVTLYIVRRGPSSAVTRSTRGLLRPRTRRIGSVLVVCVVGAVLVLLSQRLSITSGLFYTYSDDDAAAMNWLRDNARPGEVLANDGPRDAASWAPYEAHVPLLLPRALPVDRSGEREMVLAHIGRLELVPDVRAIACALRVGYVYRGAAGTGWEAQRFPAVAELQQSSALEEVFSSGDAAIFRLHCEN